MRPTTVTARTDTDVVGRFRVNLGSSHVGVVWCVERIFTSIASHTRFSRIDPSCAGASGRVGEHEASGRRKERGTCVKIARDGVGHAPRAATGQAMDGPWDRQERVVGRARKSAGCSRERRVPATCRSPTVSAELRDGTGRTAHGGAWNTNPETNGCGAATHQRSTTTRRVPTSHVSWHENEEMPRRHMRDGEETRTTRRSHVLTDEKPQVTTLANGLRVATETVPFAQTATVGVWIDAGSRFETAKSNGTAHFLEHMAFKGTKTRTTKGLEEEVENLGAHLNAYTSREQTTYYAKVLKGDVPKAVDILSDILQNSSLQEHAVERERSVILREMEEIEGQPEEVLFDHLHATAFQHSPLGRTILGPAENVRSITRGDLADYIAAHYTAPRMVITGAGAVEHQQLVKLADTMFAKLPTEGVSTKDLLQSEPSIFTGSEVRIQDDDMPACHFAVAFEGAGWTDPDSVTLMVMQTLLGSWDKSSYAGINSGPRLAQNVAANKICNSYTAFNTNYADTGLFGVYAVSEVPEKLDELAFFMMNELTGLCYNVDPDDLMRAKNQLKANLVLSMDNTSASCEDIGRQMLTYGRRIPKSEMFARIDAVTEDAVKAAADKYIYDKDMAIAAMGKTQFLPDYNWFRRRTYWLRY